MDPRTQAAAGPLYLREVRASGGATANVAIAPLPVADELDGRLAPLRAGVKTGWVNGYLCV
jgi:hypothetical protein